MTERGPSHGPPFLVRSCSGPPRRLFEGRPPGFPLISAPSARAFRIRRRRSCWRRLRQIGKTVLNHGEHRDHGDRTGKHPAEETRGLTETCAVPCVSRFKWLENPQIAQISRNGTGQRGVVADSRRRKEARCPRFFCFCLVVFLQKSVLIGEICG